MNPCRRSGPATVRARHLQVPATGQRTDGGSAAERSDNLYCGGGYPGPVEHPWAFNPGNFSKWCHLQQKSEMFDKARKAALSDQRSLLTAFCVNQRGAGHLASSLSSLNTLTFVTSGFRMHWLKTPGLNLQPLFLNTGHLNLLIDPKYSVRLFVLMLPYFQKGGLRDPKNM